MGQRDKQKQATRASLLKTARGLFAAHGYEAVGIREIAQAAGRSTGAVFAHWPDKAAIFLELTGIQPSGHAFAQDILACTTLEEAHRWARRYLMKDPL